MLSKAILALLDSGATLDVAPIINDCASRLALNPDRVAQLMAAIGDVESAWGYGHGWPGTRGNSIVGADGHGQGYVQVDDRAHPGFCAGGAMHDPQKNIEAGTTILVQYLALTSDLSERAGVGAYNAGPGRVRRCVEAGGQVDDVTEHHNYTQRIDAALVHRGFAPLQG